MEILNLLRLNGKRLAALGTIGVVAGALSAFVVSRQATTYDSSTTVFVSQALPDGASAFDVSPLVADFQKAVTLPQVRQAVADDLQIPFDDVEVVATRNGNDGGSVEVVAAASSAETAEAISQSVATGGMRFLAQREVSRAESVETLRQKQVDEAKTARDALLVQNAYVNPVSSYNDTLDRFNKLSLDRSDPTLNITAEARAAAAAEATSLRGQLPQLQALAEEYQTAQTRLDDATGLLKAAKENHTAAQEVLAAATTDVAISPGDTEAASKVAPMLQGFAAAVIAVFVVGIAFFLFADSKRRTPAAASTSASPQPVSPKAAPAAKAQERAAVTSGAATATAGTATTPASNAPASSTPTSNAPASSTPATSSRPQATGRPQTSTGTRSQAATPAAATPTATTPAASRPAPSTNAATTAATASSAATPAKAATPARSTAPTVDARNGGTKADTRPAATPTPARADDTTTKRAADTKIAAAPGAAGNDRKSSDPIDLRPAPAKSGARPSVSNESSSMFARSGETPKGGADAKTDAKTGDQAEAKGDGKGDAKADPKAADAKAADTKTSDGKADPAPSGRDRKAATNRRRLPGS